jgi:hypothetical protein
MSARPWTLAEIAGAILSRNSDNARDLARQVLAGAKPSADVIEKWRSYLPADCVNTMIQMGWDKTD